MIMMNFGKCICYLTALAILSHFFGEALPRRHFHPMRAPWKSAKWEKDGKIYDRLAIRRWMPHMPDMSRVLPDMVKKELGDRPNATHVDQLIRETCVAEVIHDALAILGFGCVLLWKKAGGWIIALLFALGNLPFILIQRYNRPRLLRLHARLLQREQRAQKNDASIGENVLAEERKETLA